jgi:hypothetical protein
MGRDTPCNVHTAGGGEGYTLQRPHCWQCRWMYPARPHLKVMERDTLNCLNRIFILQIRYALSYLSIQEINHSRHHSPSPSLSPSQSQSSLPFCIAANKNHSKIRIAPNNSPRFVYFTSNRLLILLLQAEVEIRLLQENNAIVPETQANTVLNNCHHPYPNISRYYLPLKVLSSEIDPAEIRLIR